MRGVVQEQWKIISCYLLPHPPPSPFGEGARTWYFLFTQQYCYYQHCCVAHLYFSIYLAIFIWFYKYLEASSLSERRGRGVRRLSLNPSRIFYYCSSQTGGKNLLKWQTIVLMAMWGKKDQFPSFLKIIPPKRKLLTWTQSIQFSINARFLKAQ